MIPSDIIVKAKEHIETASLQKNSDYFCISRDIFQARLDSFILKTNKYLYPGCFAIFDFSEEESL